MIYMFLSNNPSSGGGGGGGINSSILPCFFCGSNYFKCLINTNIYEMIGDAFALSFCTLEVKLVQATHCPFLNKNRKKSIRFLFPYFPLAR